MIFRTAGGNQRQVVAFDQRFDGFDQDGFASEQRARVGDVQDIAAADVEGDVGDILVGPCAFGSSSEKDGADAKMIGIDVFFVDFHSIAVLVEAIVRHRDKVVIYAG